MMNLVMTSALLAMKMCGLTVSDFNFGIEWHIVAMYGPSFFTGSLIARFGAPRIVALGLLLEAARRGSGFPASPRCTSGRRCSCSASAGISLSSAPPRWCWRRTGRRNATRCRRLTISWCSA